MGYLMNPTYVGYWVNKDWVEFPMEFVGLNSSTINNPACWVGVDCVIQSDAFTQRS